MPAFSSDSFDHSGRDGYAFIMLTKHSYTDYHKDKGKKKNPTPGTCGNLDTLDLMLIMSHEEIRRFVYSSALRGSLSVNEKVSLTNFAVELGAGGLICIIRGSLQIHTYMRFEHILVEQM